MTRAAKTPPPRPVRAVCETCRWWGPLAGVPARIVVCKNHRADRRWMVQTGPAETCAVWQERKE